MIPGFEGLVEQRIKQAQEKGEFDNLEGNHKPLKFSDSNVPEELRLAHKILKNAGFTPPEVELKKKIQNTEDLLDNAKYDSEEQRKIQKKLNFYLMKLETMRASGGGSLSLTTELYRNQMLKKLS
jgi:DnaJ homologue, subfamily C, member 28, conserved domain